MFWRGRLYRPERPEGGEPAELHQRAEPRPHAPQVRVMPQPGSERRLKPRLIGIELPGMEVGNERKLLPEKAREPEAGVPKRQDPQIRPPPPWQGRGAQNS